MRPSSWIALAAAGVLAVAGWQPLLAQTGATVSGRVTSTAGAPLAGADVAVNGTALVARTDSAGRYRLENVPGGERALEARLVGYASAVRTLYVPAAGEVTTDFVLAAAVTQLAEVTVVGTRQDLAERRERLAQIPGSVALIPSGEIRSTRQANLKDVLRFTPGVYVQPRFGAADESQISVRGSGLRNNFHARGINLLVNGMPYRNADGFTDFESLELLTTEAIEVYKGANAFRYGGSTLGGAINLETKTGYTAGLVDATAEGGSWGFYKGQLSSGGTSGGFDWYGSYARTSLDGFRAWSENRRDRVNLHAGYVLSPTVDLRSFYFFAHVREHLPGSLTAAQLEADPRQAVPTNVTNRWGRDYDLHHVGLQLRTQLGPTQRLEVSPYFQYRDIDHPIFQVINQQSRDLGAEVRYENTTPIGGRKHRLTVGLQPAVMDMHNRRFQNAGGAHGDLTKDQTDRVYNLGLYAEDLLGVTGRLSLVVGARLDHSIRKTADHFLSDGDQSDRRVYNPVSPRLGLLYDLPAVQGQLYANASRTFEPPLLSELNSLTVPGFVQLAGQAAWQFEVGTRGRHAGLDWDLSLYDVELTNEILNQNVPPFPGAPFTVPTYRNAPRTRHYGLEAGAQYQLPGNLFTRADGGDWVTLRAAYTFARYRFVRDSLYAGHEIPGAPRHTLSAEVKYSNPAGFNVAPSVEWVPEAYFVNSANTDRNRGWVIVGTRADWTISRSGLTAFVEGRNLTNTRRSPSVQVDNANGQYYEPMDGRAVYAGLRFTR
ncbi:MAG TPA: TonB-dependent receptor [Gemmatimonadales bacterium]|nr:TonB-dependent receptor [Gemmatimonadales bacterium]